MAEDEEVVFTTSTGPVRVITAASLFDGHDAAINVMRRLIQSSGAEVIHLGHDQSAKAVVDCAIQEDAHAVALTSYQGGHVEYFTYIRQLLDEAGCEHVRIFGGGGGTITPPAPSISRCAPSVSASLIADRQKSTTSSTGTARSSRAAAISGESGAA